MPGGRARALAVALIGLAALAIDCAAEGRTAPATDRSSTIDSTLQRLAGISSKFEAKVFRDEKGASMPYRLFRPAGAAAGRKLPLVVFLHGGNGVGTDNLRQISGGNLLGSSLWLLPENQESHPCFVFAPQAEHEWEERELSGFALLVVKAIESLEGEHDIDPRRVYLTGQSSGGYGTWNLIAHRPDLFAAAAPLCGGGDSSMAAGLRGIPIWAFHGLDDEVVDPSESRGMIAAVKRAGGNPKLTEYPGVGHDVWLMAYTEPGLITWLFEQTRPR